MELIGGQRKRESRRVRADNEEQAGQRLQLGAEVSVPAMAACIAWREFTKESAVDEKRCAGRLDRARGRRGGRASSHLPMPFTPHHWHHSTTTSTTSLCSL